MLLLCFALLMEGFACFALLCCAALLLAIAFASAPAFASLLLAWMVGREEDQLNSVNSPPPKKGNLLMVVSMKARQFAIQFKSDFYGVASNSQESDD